MNEKLKAWISLKTLILVVLASFSFGAGCNIAGRSASISRRENSLNARWESLNKRESAFSREMCTDSYIKYSEESSYACPNQNHDGHFDGAAWVCKCKK